ncbi:unnamed protein product [Caenorhabditis auriculariae]|uniref:Uncharacterized protein n=1 Tax=Caenorhabditis auriculariae TaxID=2777116 RepID=A0A8S1GU04_9PELO|nr:unnamed protein product [Caenorhabditis auriculariae]
MHRYFSLVASAIVLVAFLGSIQAVPLPVTSTELATIQPNEQTAIDTLGDSNSRVKRQGGCGCCGCGCCCCRPRCCCCCRRCCTCCRTCCCTRCCTCCRPCCCGCCGCGCCGCGGGGRKRRSREKLRIAHAQKESVVALPEGPVEGEEPIALPETPVDEEKSVNLPEGPVEGGEEVQEVVPQNSTD